MAMRLSGAGYARRALSVIAGSAVMVLVASVTPADASVTITEFGTPFDNSSPGGITVGPDGNVWFTEVQGAAATGWAASPRTSPARRRSAMTTTPAQATGWATSRPARTATYGSPSWAAPISRSAR